MQRSYLHRTQRMKEPSHLFRGLVRDCIIPDSAVTKVVMGERRIMVCNDTSRDSIAVLYIPRCGWLCAVHIHSTKAQRDTGRSRKIQGNKGRVGCSRNVGMYTARQFCCNGVRNDGLIRLKPHHHASPSSGGLLTSGLKEKDCATKIAS